MSECEHSLPPDVKNKAHGLLKVRIGNVVWVDPSVSSSQLLLRIKFWGEKGPGVILKPLGSPLEMVSNEVKYTIRCTQPGFISYLMDMGSLCLDVTDTQWRLLGTIKINLKLYLKKDPSSKLNLASNFGFSNIEVQGTFPVIFPSTPPKKIGEIELSVFSEFGEVFGKVSKETEAVEIVPRPEKQKEKNSPINKGIEKEKEIFGYDNRVANSLVKDLAKDYNASKIVASELENKETFKNYREERNMAKRIKEEKELPKEDLKSDSNQSIEWENLKNRAERLIKKVEASSNVDYLQEVHPAKDEEFMIPSISELKALSFPQEIAKPEIQEKAFHELNSVTHLKLQITSMHLLIFRKDSNPYLECLVPLPAIEGNRTDSFRISHKSLNGDSFLFNHESLHHLVVNDGVFSKLAPSSIKFKLMMYDKGKAVEVGKGELLWEKILLAKGFVMNTDLEIVTEESKARKSVSKIVAKLGVACSLINEKKPFVESLQAESDKLKKQESSKSYLLYLYIDYITKLRQPCQNLYLTYKTFPEPERITTDVIWNYKDSQPITHKMVTAVTATESLSSKLTSSNLILEVWNKPNSGPDELFGICKLPLLLFSSYILSGDALSSSVYPIIAFDELRPITSLKTGEEIGFIKVCLAMGSPLQVNKLRQNHEAVKVFVPEPVQEEKKEEIQETEEKVEFAEKSIQIEESRHEKYDPLGQSIESIGDIADFLNQRGKNAEVPEKLQHPETKSPEKPKEEPKPTESLEFFPIQPSENLFTVQALTPEEVIAYLKSALESENINLEQELKIADRFQYGYMHRESFTYFLQELRLNLSQSQINTFISFILDTRPTSNTRRVMFSDILSTLGLIQPLYLKHSFTITVSSIFSCPLLNKLSGSQIFVKYMFPTENSFIESEMLEAGNIVQVNLKSVHSCTFPSASSLSECFSDKLEGIPIFLCRYGAKGEERVVGKGILPIEEIIEMENVDKLNRVICLYGDLSEQLGVLRNDLIGKIRVLVEYSKSHEYDAVSASSELVFEKQTQVNRKIQRNQVLAVVLEGFTEFSRGLRYLKSSGVIFTNKNKFRFCFSTFHEDRDLLKEYPAVDMAVIEVCDKLTLNEVKYIELNLSAKSLEYFNHQTSLLTVFFDQELVGSCKIPLLQLLLHSSAKGEYAVLNEFGQFMGLVSLTLSFGLDNHHPTKPESPVRVPKVVQPPPQPQVPSTKLLISIDSALNLPTEHNGESLNAFIQFSWVDGKIYETKSILRSSCPCWNFFQELHMPLNIKLLQKPLVLALMHKSSRGSIKIGESEIDLDPLINVKVIDGWYHIVENNRQVGQVKIKITSEDDLQFRLTGKVKQEVFDRLPSPKVIEKTVTVGLEQMNKYEERLKSYHKSLELAEDEDIFAKHYDNMRAIENLSKTLEMRLSGSSQRFSPLRKTPEKEAFQKFVPVDLYSSNRSPGRTDLYEQRIRENSPIRETLYHSAVIHSSLTQLHRKSPPRGYLDRDDFNPAHPLRKSREISPVDDVNNLVHSLRKSRETSPLDEFHRNNPAHPLRKSRETSPLSEYYRKNEISRVSPPRYTEAYSALRDHQKSQISPPRSYENYSGLRDHQKSQISPPRSYENYSGLRDPQKTQISPPRSFENYLGLSDPQRSQISPPKGIENYSRFKEPQKESPNFYEHYQDVASSIERSRELFPAKNEYETKGFAWESEVKHDDEDDWDSDRIADVLKTIQEAAEISVDQGYATGNYGRADSEFTLMDKGEMRAAEEWRRDEGQEGLEKSGEWKKQREFEREGIKESEEFEERRENLRMPVERVESVIDKVNKRRMSPKISRPALPKSLLSDPEISRIAAIMKGSK